MTSSWSNRSSNPRRVTGMYFARQGYACTYSRVAAACISKACNLGRCFAKHFCVSCLVSSSLQSYELGILIIFCFCSWWLGIVSDLRFRSFNLSLGSQPEPICLFSTVHRTSLLHFYDYKR